MKTALKKNAAACALFASFLFIQFVILRMGNQAGRGLLSGEWQEKVYPVLQIFAIGGFLAFFLIDGRIKNERKKKATLFCALGLLVPGAGVMLFCSTDSVWYLAVTCLTVFCMTVIGGYVYLRMAVLSSKDVRPGFCMGIGYSAALVLQYVFQLVLNLVPVLVVLLTACFFCIGAAFVRLPDTGREPRALRQVEARPARLAIVCVITLAMLFFIAYYNGYIHHLQIASGYTEYSVYTWPRLLMIPGVLLSGAVGEYKKGKYLPVFALCVVVIALLNAVLAEKTGAYWLNMSLYYISLSVIVSYYHLTFWRLAVKTVCPALWAPMGRILDSAAILPSVFLSLSTLPSGVVLAMNIAALAVIIVLTAVNGDFNFSARKEEETPVSRRTEEIPSESAGIQRDGPELVRERCGLTPAELKVLKELVQTEDKQAVIAERLCVKVRTVQANVTSIYRKTGVTTRSGLVQLCRDLEQQRFRENGIPSLDK